MLAELPRSMSEIMGLRMMSSEPVIDEGGSRESGSGAPGP